jgi:hypothetical protein
MPLKNRSRLKTHLKSEGNEKRKLGFGEAVCSCVFLGLLDALFFWHAVRGLYLGVTTTAGRGLHSHVHVFRKTNPVEYWIWEIFQFALVFAIIFVLVRWIKWTVKQFRNNEANH